MLGESVEGDGGNDREGMLGESVEGDGGNDRWDSISSKLGIAQ